MRQGFAGQVWGSSMKLFQPLPTPFRLGTKYLATHTPYTPVRWKQSHALGNVPTPTEGKQSWRRADLALCRDRQDHYAHAREAGRYSMPYAEGVIDGAAIAECG